MSPVSEKHSWNFECPNCNAYTLNSTPRVKTKKTIAHLHLSHTCAQKLYCKNNCGGIFLIPKRAQVKKGYSECHCVLHWKDRVGCTCTMCTAKKLYPATPDGLQTFIDDQVKPYQDHITRLIANTHRQPGTLPWARAEWLFATTESYPLLSLADRHGLATIPDCAG